MIRKALAFCVPRKSLIGITTLFAVTELVFLAFHYFLAMPLLNILIPTILLGLPLVFMFALNISSAIVIRKDCYECRLDFHIVAHEQTHLRLNSLDEFRVEEETLKKTAVQLIPILLSNHALCEDCFFRWRKMYCQATSNYLKKSASSP
jgi:hypothetical protein